MRHVPTISRESITAVVLAGGRALRMGGQDKGLIEVGGRPAIEYPIDAVSSQVGALLISANRNQASYRTYGVPVVGDSQSGFPGPLAGILSAMDAARTDYLLTLPCDALLLRPGFVSSMTDAFAAGAGNACLAWDGQRRQPMFALLHCELAQSLRAFLGAGGRRALTWVESLQPTLADFSGRSEWFFNMNTPADRAWLERQLVIA
ncbi:MAG: molybdenum cofactor guanylyltransferase MobA [Gammaproteobacteria bacterium]